MATRASLQQAAARSSGTGKEQVVLRRFRVVFNAVKSHFRSVERSAGISGAQLWALAVIGERPAIGVNDLAHAMDIHQSTASNLVRSLVESGLVRSQREATDRRVVQLTATARGQRTLARAPAPFGGVLPEALSRLDARTLSRLDRDLSKLLELLGPAEEGNLPLGDDRS